MTDRRISRHPLVPTVEAAVAAGVDWVQVREKDLEGGALCDLVAEIAAAARRGAAARDGEVRVLVNRRTDVALAAEADGVHLGFDAVAARDARRLLGTAKLVGASCHDAAAVGAAAEAGASYAHLAPVFEPRSKRSAAPPLGTAAVAAAARRGLPILAQGGITAENARAALDAGAAGV
ncbi:MAG: thiamine phosphate synthase, partial [Deltaproteobacteria bacterium]